MRGVGPPIRTLSPIHRDQAVHYSRVIGHRCGADVATDRVSDSVDDPPTNLRPFPAADGRTDTRLQETRLAAAISPLDADFSHAPSPCDLPQTSEFQ